jgi:hypothetical protein
MKCARNQAQNIFFLEHAGELRVVVLKDRKIGPSYNGESSTELTTGGI